MSQFTPLSELDGYSSDQMSWQVALPDYAPADKIGLNVHRLEKLAHIAGLGHLRIETESGDITEYQAKVIGNDDQGNAFAGMSAVVTVADLENTSLKNPKCIPDLWYDYKWGDGKISVNTTEMSDRIMRGRIDDGSLRSSHAWSRQLEKAVKAGIKQSANEQLISNVPASKAITLGAITSIGVVLALATNHTSLIGYAGEIGFQYGLNQGTNSLTAHANGLPLGERRLSLIPSYQVDRLAVVHGLTRASKLIKKV